ncbi:hypothetical protein pipiens_000844, partial [Culex pipiens pipiens]
CLSGSAGGQTDCVHRSGTDHRHSPTSPASSQAVNPGDDRHDHPPPRQRDQLCHLHPAGESGQLGPPPAALPSTAATPATTTTTTTTAAAATSATLPGLLHGGHAAETGPGVRSSWPVFDPGGHLRDGTDAPAAGGLSTTSAAAAAATTVGSLRNAPLPATVGSVSTATASVRGAPGQDQLWSGPGGGTAEGWWLLPPGA